MSSKTTGTVRWVEAENGYEHTTSQELIRQTMVALINKYRYLVLLHKGYQSGHTVLVEIDDRGLLIDRPPDWPGSHKKVKVLFRDNAKVWNYFTAKIITESKDTLKAGFPTELFRMQRRVHFRVLVSNECTASFVKNDARFSNLKVVDLSVGGMMVCLPGTENCESLNDEDVVSDIAISHPNQAGDVSEPIVLQISQGVVVRSLISENGQECKGVKFILRGVEEEKLMRFVRQRELDDIRKGLV